MVTVTAAVVVAVSTGMAAAIRPPGKRLEMAARLPTLPRGRATVTGIAIKVRLRAVSCELR